MAKKNQASDSRSKPVLVAGSAGFIGRQFMRKLSQEGRPALSLYHSHLPEPLSHINPVFADILRPEPLLPILQKADQVLFLAWLHSFQRHLEEGKDFSNSPNIQMIRNFVAAMEQTGTRRIVFVSALGASRHAESAFLREKYAAESIILNSRVPEKIILRSSLVYGKLGTQDRFLSAISQLMKVPWFYPVPKHQEKLAPVSVDDLNKILLYLLDVPLDVSSHVIEVTGGESLAIEEIFRMVSQGIGRSRQFPITGSIGSALTPLFERLHPQARKSLPSLRDLLSVGNFLDKETGTNNPLTGHLPMQEARMQDSMVNQPQMKLPVI